MQINILDLLDGARKAEGLTVIIDVFRAFSTVCYAVDRGAGPVYPVGSVEEAFLLKMRFDHAILAGERNERPPEGFDLGNSPWLLLQADVAGRPFIHTTSSGTQGIVNALQATEILTGSFVNAGAIVRYIRRQNPEIVSLVCMGYACLYPTDEDTLCAEYIRNELLGIESDWGYMRERMKTGSGARFFNPENREWSPEEDFELCLDRNRFDFVLKVIQRGDILSLQRIGG
jgi:2-phosphosulfolactate phosphatase